MLQILDFGLMTQVSEDVKVGMIEAISHLIHRDYEAIVEVRGGYFKCLGVDQLL